MEIPLLTDIVILFTLSVGVLYVCQKLRIPSIIGFLLTGMIAGPHGLELVQSAHEVEVLAEIGVILLLFSIGIEFSLKKLLHIRKTVLLGGTLQVTVTIGSIVFLLYFFTPQLSLGQSIFIGFLVALSSTAVVLKLLQQQSEIDTPHGRTVLGILIFQDIIIVPMILLTPFLAGSPSGSGQQLWLLLFKALVIILLILVAAKWVVPQILLQITRTRNPDLFLLTIVVLCFGVAWLTHFVGLSLALGAFLAGLIISESEYSHHALSNILPFRDIFTTFFFVSIGMMMDFSFVGNNFLTIMLFTSSAIIIKALIAGGVALVLRLPVRVAVLAGLALAQIGEFSFILSHTGISAGLLDANLNQYFLSVTILTMAATPLLIQLGYQLAEKLDRLLPQRQWSVSRHPSLQLKDHLIIIGYGLNGKNVAQAAHIAGIPFIIIEMNPDTVRAEQARGTPILFGDATRETVLAHAGVDSARVVVIAINDPTATRRITEMVHKLNPSAHLIVRTRYVQEVQPLFELGASEVIPEEFETSVEIFVRVLHQYLVPQDTIEQLVSRIRAEGYKMFRTLSTGKGISPSPIAIPNLEVTTVRLEAQSPIVNHTLAELDFRNRYNVLVVAVQRQSEILPTPPPHYRLQPNDVLVLLGHPEKITTAIQQLTLTAGKSPSSNQ